MPALWIPVGPPAPTAAIVRAEQRLLGRLPPWLRERLGVANGWRWESPRGKLRLFPVLNEASPAERERTYFDLVRATAEAVTRPDFPRQAVVIGRTDDAASDLLILWRESPGEGFDPTPHLWSRRDSTLTRTDLLAPA